MSLSLQKHYPSEKYVLLHPTSPFRIRSDLIACIDQFEKSSARSIMSVTLPWSAPKDLYAPSEIDGSFIPKKILPEQKWAVLFDTGCLRF